MRQGGLQKDAPQGDARNQQLGGNYSEQQQRMMGNDPNQNPGMLQNMGQDGVNEPGNLE